ncbi:golgi SNAP receptor complex member bos1 [Lactarius deliciosus]|nr:golgi SNAP receptor complex member bos1 [Lactarius deliciosus]
MNSLYTLGVRHSSFIQADLERLRLSYLCLADICLPHGDEPNDRTIDDYDSVARREIIKAKQEKATSHMRRHKSTPHKFKSDYAEFRKESEKNTGTPLTPGAGRRRRATGAPTSTQSDTAPENPFRANNSGAHAHLGASRDAHALHNASLYVAQKCGWMSSCRRGGGARQLVDQRVVPVLKDTQPRLRDAANTLGLSWDVVGWIERRSMQDMYIFWVGAVFTFFCFYLIWRYD